MGLTKKNLQGKQFKIIVNTQEKFWKEDTITFEQLAALAFPKAKDLLYSMTYHKGEHNVDGILSPHNSVKVVEGMIFNIALTNNA